MSCGELDIILPLRRINKRGKGKLMRPPPLGVLLVDVGDRRSAWAR